MKFNALLRDINVGVRATDDRKIEVLAQDLPCFGGAQLAIDVTLRSAVGARTDKEIRYPELTTGRCRLVVVAIETGGRWSEEAVDLLWQLSCAKARDVPRRWSRMLSTSCALAFAASLVEPAQYDHMCEAGGEPPSLAEVLLHDPR